MTLGSSAAQQRPRWCCKELPAELSCECSPPCRRRGSRMRQLPAGSGATTLSLLSRLSSSNSGGGTTVCAEPHTTLVAPLIAECPDSAQPAADPGRVQSQNTRGGKVPGKSPGPHTDRRARPELDRVVDVQVRAAAERVELREYRTQQVDSIVCRQNVIIFPQSCITFTRFSECLFFHVAMSVT